MLGKLLKALGGASGEAPPPPPKKSKPRTKGSKPKTPPQLSPKDAATAAGEPWVAITSVEVDPENINAGAFTLDWNDKFLANLIRAGYKIRPDDLDQTIVDRWFQTVCRNVALEVYEQVEADPAKRDGDLRKVSTKDLGQGRTEVS